MSSGWSKAWVRRQESESGVNSQPEGLKASSPGLSAQRDTPGSSVKLFLTLKGSQNSLAPFQGAILKTTLTGGLRFASTPGYCS